MPKCGKGAKSGAKKSGSKKSAESAMMFPKKNSKPPKGKGLYA
jgi:hypothetical protein